MAKTEIERRFVVTGIDPDIQRSPSNLFEQGYLVTTDPGVSVSVRVVDGEKAFLRPKLGKGIERDDSRERSIELQNAESLLKFTCPDKLVKRRYVRDGWEVDFFEGPLAGLVILERELTSRDEPVTLPPWIHGAYEVTDSVTNQHLARLATELSLAPADRPLREYLVPKLPCIVLTGGPCSGKSTIMEILRHEMGELIHCVPETASILMKQVGICPSTGRRDLFRFQRTLYRVQRAFEEISIAQAHCDGKRAVLVDRGTVDIAAYLPGGLSDFDAVCTSTCAHEYERYSRVICLETPSREIYNANRQNNPARQESYQEASVLSERTRRVWERHRSFMAIPSECEWNAKVERVRQVLREVIG
jgi:CYTH domain-containing protein/predicted ATPase